MVSYAARCQEENGIVTLDVETTDINTSNKTPLFDRDSVSLYIELDRLAEYVGETAEGDIIVVEHDGKDVIFVYRKDDDEKQKRIEFLKSIM